MREFNVSKPLERIADPPMVPARQPATVVLLAGVLSVELCDRLEADKKKYSSFLKLANAYGLLQDWKITEKGHTYHVVKPRKASRKELQLFHTADYLNTCEQYSRVCVLDRTGNKKLARSFQLSPDLQLRLKKYGLHDDCKPFPELWEYMRIVAGGSLKAADILKLDRAKVVMHFFGGRHHAYRDQSRGYCFVNDIVLAIDRLRLENCGTKAENCIPMERVLYIDLDIHHGDGVMNKYRNSDDVFCLSLHHYAKGFYPTTGSSLEIGVGRGIMHNLNIPLGEGTNDETVCYIFCEALIRIVVQFCPKAIVVCLGADGLSRDPIGCWNLTTRGLLTCVREVLRFDIPTLILGGGGYNPIDTARLWTVVTAEAAGIQISDDIPEFDEYMRYSRSFKLQTTALLTQIDMNNRKIIVNRLKLFELKFRKRKKLSEIIEAEREKDKENVRLVNNNPLNNIKVCNKPFVQVSNVKERVKLLMKNKGLKKNRRRREKRKLNCSHEISKRLKRSFDVSFDGKDKDTLYSISTPPRSILAHSKFLSGNRRNVPAGTFVPKTPREELRKELLLTPQVGGDVFEVPPTPSPDVCGQNKQWLEEIPPTPSPPMEGIQHRTGSFSKNDRVSKLNTPCGSLSRRNKTLPVVNKDKDLSNSKGSVKGNRSHITPFMSRLTMDSSKDIELSPHHLKLPSKNQTPLASPPHAKSYIRSLNGSPVMVSPMSSVVSISTPAKAAGVSLSKVFIPPAGGVCLELPDSDAPVCCQKLTSRFSLEFHTCSQRECEPNVSPSKQTESVR